MTEVVSVIRPIDVRRPIPEQVRANLGHIVRAVMGHGVARVLFSEAVGIDAEGDGALRDFYDGALGRIEAALRTGQRLGVVREGDVVLRARCLLGFVKEPVFQAALRGESVDPEPLLEELVLLLGGGALRG